MSRKVSFSCSLCLAAPLLALAVLGFSGCSGDGNANMAPDGESKVTGRFGLDKSEFIALKKANKNPKDLKKAILKQNIDNLRKRGVVVETTKSGKTTNKAR